MYSHEKISNLIYINLIQPADFIAYFHKWKNLKLYGNVVLFYIFVSLLRITRKYYNAFEETHLNLIYEFPHIFYEVPMKTLHCLFHAFILHVVCNWTIWHIPISVGTAFVPVLNILKNRKTTFLLIKSIRSFLV